MEVYVFWITIGMLIAFGLVGLGVCLGRYMADDVKGVSRDVFKGDYNLCVYPGGNTDVYYCSLGSVHGKEHCRCDLGRAVEEVKGDNMDAITVNVEIKNVPHSFYENDRDGFIVARNVDSVLWWYGLYDTKDRAREVALEIGNGVFFEY